MTPPLSLAIPVRSRRSISLVCQYVGNADSGMTRRPGFFIAADRAASLTDRYPAASPSEESRDSCEMLGWRSATESSVPGLEGAARLAAPQIPAARTSAAAM